MELEGIASIGIRESGVPSSPPLNFIKEGCIPRIGLSLLNSRSAVLTLVKMVRVTNVYAICAFAAIGGGLFGFDISSMSGVLGTQAYIRYFNNPLGSAVNSPQTLSDNMN